MQCILFQIALSQMQLSHALSMAHSFFYFSTFHCSCIFAEIKFVVLKLVLVCHFISALPHLCTPCTTRFNSITIVILKTKVNRSHPGVGECVTINKCMNINYLALSHLWHMNIKGVEVQYALLTCNTL